MSFDDSDISGVQARLVGADLVVTWSSTAPAGSIHQVYLDGRLAWSGRGTRAVIPAPAARVQIVVGVADADLDQAGDVGFPALADSRVRLRWTGGRYLDQGLTGFAVYGESEPGGGIDYESPLATVPAGNPNDGFGVGGFGEGGFGYSAVAYQWTSPPLSAGEWNFGVVPTRADGSEGTALEESAEVVARPLPPPRASDGSRVRIAAYDSGTRVASIEFLPSPTVSPGGVTYELSITGGTPTSGSFSYQWAFITGLGSTGSIAWNASAAAVQAAIEAAAGFGPGDVVCSGSDLPGGTITIEFTDPDVPLPETYFSTLDSGDPDWSAV